LLGYRPGIVLLFTGSRDLPISVRPAAIIETLERDAVATGAVPPLYIVGPRMVEDPPLVALVTSRASLRSRVLGIRGGPVPDELLLTELQAAFSAAYPDLGSQSLAFGALPRAHDALYLVSYALAAAAEAREQASAEEVLSGFLRVTDAARGTPVEIGPGAERLGAGLSLLRTGGTIILQGASGSNGFDVQTHTRTGSARPYVFTVEGTLSDVEPMAAFSDVSDRPD
jgi:hypothetical protein